MTTKVSWDKDKILFNNCEHFPKSIRALITAPSGSGKTFLLINFLIGFCELHQKDYLEFEKLIFVSPTLQVPEYKIIIESFKNGLTKPMIREVFNLQNDITDYLEAIKELASDMKHKSPIEVECYNNPETIPPPDEINKTRKKTLIIFDDCTVLPQSNIEQFFVYGRPLGIESIFLTQSFFQTKKRTIRDQCNLFILFKTSLKDLKNIYDHIAACYFKTFEDFKEFCDEAWSKKYGYVLINKDSGLINMTHQGGYITLEEYNNKVKKANDANKKLLESFREARNAQVGFYEEKKEEYKPLTDVMKDLNEIKTKMPTVDQFASKIAGDKENTAQRYKQMIEEVMNTRDEENFLTIVEKEDGSGYSFSFLETLKKRNNDHGFPKIFRGDSTIKFNINEGIIEAYKAKKGTISLPLNKETVTILTQSVETPDPSAVITYQNIVEHCMGEELRLLKSYNKFKDKRKEILDILRKEFHFKFIRDNYGFKGEGYREMSKYIPVAISPNSDDRLKRYLILLGAIKSGNTNSEILQEGTEILDSLMKEKKIDKKIYKILYYKLKDQLIKK